MLRMFNRFRNELGVWALPPGDRVRFLPDITGAVGPFEIEVELRYQPIGFRSAQNLKRDDAEEPRRFVSFYERWRRTRRWCWRAARRASRNIRST